MASEVYFSTVVSYEVRPRQPVVIKVVINEGKVGATVFEWQGEHYEPDNQSFAVGKPGEDLRGRRLGCLTKVTDPNHDVFVASVTYTLSGGTQEKTFTYKIEVLGSGGWVNYNIDFVFI